MTHGSSIPVTVSVVPIFVNAGTAILPAILAPLASAAALLLRPRELVQTCRRRPIVPVIMLLVASLAGMGIWWLVAPTKPARPRATVDWVKAAEEYLNSLQNQQAVLANANPTTRPADAVVFRYGFSRCGYDGGPVPIQLKPCWRFAAEEAMFLSSPTVVGGRVFAATAFIDPISNEKTGMVVGLDAATGTPVWKAEEAQGQRFKPFFSSPAVTADGKYIVIGQGLHDDADSNLICLDATTGAVHWQIQTPLHIEGSPAIRSDLAVAGAGAIEGPDHKPTTHIGMVLGVRISDGKKLWQYDTNDPESSPAIDENGIVYIGSGFQGNAVLALRSESDEELKQKNQDRLVWKTRLPHPITGAITLIDDLVLAGGGNGDYVVADPHPAGIVVALDRKTGAIRWQQDMPDAVLGAVAAADGKVICPVRNGELFALNLADGKPLWRQRISGKAPVVAAPAFAKSHAYAVSRDGYLAVLDARDGKLLQRIDLNDSNKGGAEYSFSSPMVVGGYVFVGSESGGLRCLMGERVAE